MHIKGHEGGKIGDILDNRMLGGYNITLEDKNFNNYKLNDVQNDRIRLETYFRDLEIASSRL